jgi:hypothetical protein
MNKLTLESLGKRVAALERALALNPEFGKSKDWRRVVGMFEDSEFMRQVDEEGRKIRKAERAEAKRAESGE